MSTTISPAAPLARAEYIIAILETVLILLRVTIGGYAQYQAHAHSCV